MHRFRLFMGRFGVRWDLSPVAMVALGSILLLFLLLFAGISSATHSRWW